MKLALCSEWNSLQATPGGEYNHPAVFIKVKQNSLDAFPFLWVLVLSLSESRDASGSNLQSSSSDLLCSRERHCDVSCVRVCKCVNGSAGGSGSGSQNHPQSLTMLHAETTLFRWLAWSDQFKQIESFGKVVFFSYAPPQLLRLLHKWMLFCSHETSCFY